MSDSPVTPVPDFASPMAALPVGPPPLDFASPAPSLPDDVGTPRSEFGEEVDAPPPLPEPAAPAGPPPPPPPPPTPEKLKKAIDAINSAGEEVQALAICLALEDALALPDVLARDPELRGLVGALLEKAYDDCEFVHCYLSVAEDVDWMLRGLKEREGYVA